MLQYLFLAGILALCLFASVLPYLHTFWVICLLDCLAARTPKIDLLAFFFFVLAWIRAPWSFALMLLYLQVFMQLLLCSLDFLPARFIAFLLFTSPLASFVASLLAGCLLAYFLRSLHAILQLACYLLGVLSWTVAGNFTFALFLHIAGLNAGLNAGFLDSKHYAIPVLAFMLAICLPAFLLA